MKNITLALDEETLAAGRACAERHQTTLNALVRDLLARTVHTDRKAAAAEMFRLMDDIEGAIDCSILNTMSFWDALIVAAAASSGCVIVCSVDLNPGQTIQGVRIENPMG